LLCQLVLLMIIIGLILLIGGWKQIYKYKNSVTVIGFSLIKNLRKILN